MRDRKTLAFASEASLCPLGTNLIPASSDIAPTQGAEHTANQLLS